MDSEKSGGARSSRRLSIFVVFLGIGLGLATYYKVYEAMHPNYPPLADPRHHAASTRFVQAFLQDIRQGRFEDALARTDAPYQETHTVDQFRVAVETTPGLEDHQRAVIQQRETTAMSFGAGHGRIEGTLITENGELPFHAIIAEGGNYEHWYVSRLVVDGQRMP